MNVEQIRQWYDVFKDNRELVEIRALGRGNRTFSGYFSDVEKIITAIAPYDDCNLYFTLNTIDPACYSREQRDRMVKSPSTTSDRDIVKRKWILIDIDVERASGTNSTNEEKASARPIGNKVFAFLRDRGFNPPVICDSANGFHLLYRCDMENNAANTETCKKFLQVLDMYFSTEKVKVDVSTFNASRICKLYGCFSRKGVSTPERPQRQSAILKVPNEVKLNEQGRFELVAKLLPEPELPSRNNGYSSERFDVQSFINKHHIAVRNVVRSGAYTKYVLAECPFDPNHKAPDSAIFEMSNGAVGFKCFHQSCANHRWADFRRLYEPDYARHEPHYQSFTKSAHTPPKTPTQAVEPKGEPWLLMSAVPAYKIDPADFIPSGFTELDKRIIGFMRKHVSVWSGYRGCGKSTLLNMLILNAAQAGYNTALWTGELSGSEVKTWLYLQAAGKAYNRQSNFSDFYYTPDNIVSEINPWIDKHFRLYNESFGNDIQIITEKIEALKEKFDVDSVIFDNLMTLDYDRLGGADKYDAQKQLMQFMHNLAERLNIHIHLVAHPRKEMGFLRVNSISGSADITNYAQNIFIMHRINRDFENTSKDFLSKLTRTEILDSGCTNVIEVGKCRAKGSATGSFIKLWFENESNRFLNTPYENVVYGWRENEPAQPVQAQATNQNFLSNTDSVYQPYKAVDFTPSTIQPPF